MIDIIMATYNGEEYIEAQIYSLLSQSFKNWNLYVYDDCSVDSTADIVKKIVGLDKRIHLIENKKKHGMCFDVFNGIKKSNAEYVVLCDQDDLWFDNKLEVLFDNIHSLDKTCPVLLFGRGYQYDQYTKKIIGRINMNSPNTLSDYLILNGGIQGCSMIMNRSLINLITKYKCDVAMHDHFISTLAFSFGLVRAVDADLILYRKHNNNITSAIHGGMINKALKYIKSRKYFIDELHYDAINSIYESIKEDISISKRNEFELYLKLPRESKIKKIKYLISNRVRVSNSIVIPVILCLLQDSFGKNVKGELHRWEP